MSTLPCKAMAHSPKLYEDGTPMWSIAVQSDVAALEKAEREDEMKVRRERKERAELAAQQARDLAGQGVAGASPEGGFDDGEGGGLKKKRKKDGPGVTARNMSEDVRKKMSNAVASQAAGLGGKYAWMNATNAPAARPKGKGGAQSTATSAAAGPSGSSATPTTPTPASGWSRPYLPTKKSTSGPAQPAEEDNHTVVMLRDAIFVVEKESGHGGGRGAARGWGYDSVSSDCA